MEQKQLAPANWYFKKLEIPDGYKVQATVVFLSKPQKTINKIKLVFNKFQYQHPEQQEKGEKMKTFNMLYLNEVVTKNAIQKLISTPEKDYDTKGFHSVTTDR